jgi:hypothetical protein
MSSEYGFGATSSVCSFKEYVPRGTKDSSVCHCSNEPLQGGQSNVDGGGRRYHDTQSSGYDGSMSTGLLNIAKSPSISCSSRCQWLLLLLDMAPTIVESVESVRVTRGGRGAGPDPGLSISMGVDGILMALQVAPVSEALGAAWDGAPIGSDMHSGVVLSGSRIGCEHLVAAWVGTGKQSLRFDLGLKDRN